jgi:hypothetical protein
MGHEDGARHGPRVALLATGLVIATIATVLVVWRFGERDRAPRRYSIPPLPRGSILLPTSKTLPEGSLLVEASGGPQLIVAGRRKSRSLGSGLSGGALSPDGSAALLSRGGEERPGNYRISSLLTVDTRTGARRVLARATVMEALGPPFEWSPDGRTVAFRRARYSVDITREHAHRQLARVMVCTVDVRAGASRCFRDLRGVLGFAWTPDGEGLLVAGRDPSTLRVLDVATGRHTVEAVDGNGDLGNALLASGFGRSTHLVDPTLSPSQRYVGALAKLRGGDVTNVPAVFRADGTFVALGAPSREFGSGYGWSPHEDLYAYPTGRPPYTMKRIHLLDPATGRDRVLFALRRGVYPALLDFVWSPSGRWLAVASFRRQGQLLTIVDARSGDVKAEFGFDSAIAESLTDWTW